MKKWLCLLLIGLVSMGWAESWHFSNELLEVSVDAVTGRYEVLDKRIDHRWQQGGALAAAREAWYLPRMASKDELAQAPRQHIAHTMLGDARNVSDAADCSAEFQLGWTADALHLAVTVRDEVFLPASGDRDWWQADSIEFWLDSAQYAIYPEPGNAKLVRRDKTTVAEAAVLASRSSDGYAVSLSVPLAALGIHVEGGKEKVLSFSLGVNDADDAKGRQGQIYYPVGWQHSNLESFKPLRLVAVAPAAGDLAAPQDCFQEVSRLSDGNGIDYLWQQAGQPAVRVRSELIEDTPELRLSVTALDGTAKFSGEYPDIHGFVLPGDFAGMATADGSTGHLYPLHEEPFRRTSQTTAGDLPFIGIVDKRAGHGYGIFVDSCEDALWRMHKLDTDSTASGSTRVPQVRWIPTMQTFGQESRVYGFYFVAEGSYVAVAKAWRVRAAARGYVVSLKEKARHNPNVFKLMGAADIWGGNNIQFARSAKAHGIDKLLINGPQLPADMAEAASLGFLPGRYDIYTDLWENSPNIDGRSAPLPDHAVKLANGEAMTAWATFDKSRVSLKRCTALMLEAAKKVVPADLAIHPYEARFLDVTTAEGLYECYDPAHPMTRSDKRRYSEGMCAYFGNWEEGNLNLVAGGEHGKWWCARDLHYLEGMQSGGHSYYSWPAGYLKRPKSKDHDPRNPDKPTTRFQLYEKYSVGPYYRIPLWDLVFHGCITTTWYWGDATDFLLEAAPEVTPRKDLLNILYVSMPTFWVREGTWTHDRSSFLRSYFHTSKLHEAVAMEEMLSHEFLSEDHCLQKTVFADGTEVLVNFAPEVREVLLKGQSYALPQEGFAVDGPKIRQSMVWRDGHYCSQVQTADFYFASKALDPLPRMDGSSGVVSMVTVKARDKNHLHISASGDDEVIIPEAFMKGWSWRTTLVYALDDDNQRQGQIEWQRRGQQLVLPAAGIYEVLCRQASNLPDFRLELLGASLSSDGRNLDCALRLSNVGRAGNRARLSIMVDAAEAENELAAKSLWWLRPGKSRELRVAVPVSSLAGRHHFYAQLHSPGGKDLLLADNVHSWQQDIPVELSQWPVLKSVELAARPYAVELEPVNMAIDFADVLPEGGSLSAASVRVLQLQADGSYSVLPFAQFDPGTYYDGQDNVGGLLSFSYDAPAGAAQHFKVVGQDAASPMRKNGGALYVPGAEMGSGEYCGETYTARFSEGQIKGLMPGQRYGGGADFLTSFLVSSAATGWAKEEQATLNRVDLLRNGPACSVLAVNKTLRNGATYTKTYTLLPGRFYVDVELDKPAGGLYNRGFYKLAASYLDDKGNSVEMDGSRGDGAGIAGNNSRPQWFALRGQGWAHSCVAVTPFLNISFWDGNIPSLGQLGFSSDRLDNMRFAYFVYGEQPDFSFAERDYQRIQAEQAK
jgi:hypothetical protein